MRRCKLKSGLKVIGLLAILPISCLTDQSDSLEDSVDVEESDRQPDSEGFMQEHPDQVSIEMGPEKSHEALNVQQETRELVSLESDAIELFGKPNSPQNAWIHLQMRMAEITNRSPDLFSGDLIELSETVLSKAIHYCLKYKLLPEADHFIQLLKKHGDIAMQKAQFFDGILARMTQNDDKAGALWASVIKKNPGNQAARMNYGLMLAQYGFFEESLEVLNPLAGTWDADVAMLVSFRHLKLKDQADRLCENLPYNDSYIVPLNCSLHQFQEHRDAEKAIRLMESAIDKIPSGSKELDSAKILLEEMVAFKQLHQQ